jgi:hypothetical protein
LVSLLGKLIDKCLAEEFLNRKDNILNLLKTICEIFNAANHEVMAPCFANVNALSPWINFAKTVLDMEPVIGKLKKKRSLGKSLKGDIVIDKLEEAPIWALKGHAARMAVEVYE